MVDNFSRMDSIQQRRGGIVSLSPAQTPRSSDKSARESRSSESNSTNRNDKEKGVNVQVILRCRPLSEDEARIHTPVVFGPASQQKDLYDQAICPIVFEVLEGYNCTIFAYGQTGTGKTYTMEGGARKKNGEFPSDAGVIPRAVKQIFDILEAQGAEYSMKVTFLELYNEEISDLLAPEETIKFVDEKSKKSIALMEDGKGSVFVRGLEEEIVSTANEIYKILEKGSAKRRTAETLLNKQSSRSHSIFSITIHIKENTPEGEEMIKCGKLNLVDLAGSENISRSGAREGRAREAGEINKSLLTLGRVINALVEHSGHIPYRDSKLTRLLRESLGGKTKTCVIATISPSIHCLEETLSTLDYAHRAKNIKNKPEINQKMMKSAVMKDLYSEIDRLKQEVYAAREKNGIYIPKDRYIQEEAEKKAMAEKIERLELQSESKDKRVVDLQELYNSQQILTAELSEKLEKTEKKLEETEHSLFDLEEKYRQANATIKEKEFVISNLLKSEKSLVERAFQLRTELESASSDVSNLFSKIERKDKIEDGNRFLIQKFQSQLTQQLELLHKTVASSVTQQEVQLKHMEEDMESFVSTKSEATEELRDRLSKLKRVYGFGIEALDNIAVKLDGNSQSTFSSLNSEVFKGFASEADMLLQDLQSSLNKQEEKLITFAQQQRKAHLRAVDTARSVSKVTVEFFKTLDTHATKLTGIVEEAQTVNHKKLSEFENKFEECAANEERQLLEKVAELLANSNARKKNLVQMAVHDLRESASTRTTTLQHEMSTMQDSTSSIKAEWSIHMEKTESSHHEDTSAVESGKKAMQEVLLNCLEKTEMSAHQWRKAQESLVSLERNNVASVDSIVRGGMDANENLRSQFSTAVSSSLDVFDAANSSLLTSIDHSLQLDNDACTKVNSMIIPCCEDLIELKSDHNHKIIEITENAGKCLLDEYVVDEPSCSTPKKRPIDIPSIESIEELRTPASEELLRAFRDEKLSKQANGDAKQQQQQQQQHLIRASSLYEAAVSDSRYPLSAVN
ncbi:unnamed protein product [Arabidopsis thaliana]|uniref:(thale cress) hypothetical protein n=1 Tax=Arabidopsis thaliana TaxID=3702 RepID=A0A7G2ERS6_ARATH|nr:unnamed protein product [Arabidopsis thaliana]